MTLGVRTALKDMHSISRRSIRDHSAANKIRISRIEPTSTRFIGHKHLSWCFSSSLNPPNSTLQTAKACFYPVDIDDSDRENRIDANPIQSTSLFRLSA